MDIALIIVDVQNDFFEGGALGVPNSLDIIPIINNLEFENVIYTKDHHPSNHTSFKKYGGKWPSHCVIGSKGAYIHPDIKIKENSHIVHKGYNVEKDSYSGFYIDGIVPTPLHEILQGLNIKKLYFCGLAYEYCVYDTIIDAVKLGYECYLIEDGTRGINEDDIKLCRINLLKNGVNII